VAAIKRKDAAGAESAMRQHLEEIETIIAVQQATIETQTQND
jgi:DNA-binding FadR family transcriptional regulator